MGVLHIKKSLAGENELFGINSNEENFRVSHKFTQQYITN